MEKKVAIINRMVENGYHLCGRTAEEMASMMSLEDWENAEKRFMAWKN